MDTPKYIEYDGKKFCRDDKTGYYLNSTIRKRLHRYVWEKEVGPIPKGYHIHHLDGIKANNNIDNLALITAKGHERLHGAEEHRKEICRQNVKKAIEAARAWHGTEEGRAWHSKHATGLVQPRSEMKCPICGETFQGIKHQKYCSNKCRAKARRIAGVDNVVRICQICGKEFSVNKYEMTKYCGRKCQNIAHIGWAERKKSSI